MFGYAGAHRSGKTTTARAVADRLGIEFLETKVGQVFADLGIDPKAELPFEERLKVQNAILRSLEVQYDLRYGKFFVADRTPFDVLGYTMAEIRRDTLNTPELQADCMNHFRYAVNIARKALWGVMLLGPLPNPPEAATSAQACPVYMDHICTLIRAELVDAPHIIQGFHTAETPSYDLDERIEAGVKFFGGLKERLKPEPKLWTP